VLHTLPTPVLPASVLQLLPLTQNQNHQVLLLFLPVFCCAHPALHLAALPALSRQAHSCPQPPAMPATVFSALRLTGSRKQSLPGLSHPLPAWPAGRSQNWSSTARLRPVSRHISPSPWPGNHARVFQKLRAVSAARDCHIPLSGHGLSSGRPALDHWRAVAATLPALLCCV